MSDLVQIGPRPPGYCADGSYASQTQGGLKHEGLQIVFAIG